MLDGRARGPTGFQVGVQGNFHGLFVGDTAGDLLALPCNNTKAKGLAARPKIDIVQILTLACALTGSFVGEETDVTSVCTLDLETDTVYTSQFARVLHAHGCMLIFSDSFLF